MRNFFLFLIMLPAFTILQAQVVPVIRYYDSVNSKNPRETYEVLKANPDKKHGIHRIYNPIGLITHETNYVYGKALGKSVVRVSETGIIENLRFTEENDDFRNIIFLVSDGKFQNLYYERQVGGQLLKGWSLDDMYYTIIKLTDSLKLNGSGGYKLYQDQIRKHEYTIERLGMKDENPDIRRYLSEYLIYHFYTMLENYPILRKNEDRINAFAEKIESKYQHAIPDIYNSNLKYFLDTIRMYRTVDSVEDRFYRSHQLVYSIQKAEPFCDSILIMDSLIENRKILLTQYYSNKINYAVIYNTSILPVLQEITNSYEAEDDLTARLRTGSAIILKSQNFLDDYVTLEKQGVEISRTAEKITADYTKRYPGKFRQELDELEKGKNEYEQQGNPQKMVLYGQNLLNSIREMEEQFEILVNLDEQLDQNFQKDKEYYSTQEEKLYQNDFRLFEDKYLQYQELDVISEKIESGNTVLKDARFFHAGIDSLKYYKNCMDSLYPKICELYKRDYRDIFQDEIKPMKLGLNDYALLTKTDAKLKKGSELTRWMELYKQSFGILGEQKLMIESLIKRSTDEYRNGFQGVVKKEISDIKQRYSGYGNSGKLKDRIDQGAGILKDIKLTDSRYDSLAANALKFKTYALQIRDSLKTIFPGVFENDLYPLILQYESLDQIQTSSDLLTKTQRLRDNGKDMVNKYTELMSLRKQINQENSTFNSRIPKDSKWNIIIRRSTFHYYHYYKQMEKATTYSDCKTQATAFLDALRIMNNLDHNKLKEKKKLLKKSRKPEEIRKTFIS